MRIIVCIKQVPYVDKLKFDPVTRRVIREGVPNEINPFDRRAITQAVELVEKLGGETVVVTMGPPQARDALVEAFAMGVHRAVHLLGKEFAGADTLATARALGRACKKIGFDLIFCGKYSTDAETAQVPPMLAELLDLPQATGVTKLEFARKRLRATREVDDGFETVELPMPALLSAAERLIKPRRVTPEELEKAKQNDIEVWQASALSRRVDEFGLAGSPTWVNSIDSIEPSRKRIIRTANENVEGVVQQVASDLAGEGLFGEWKLQKHDAIRLPELAQKTKKQREIWVVAEVVEGKIRRVTYELLGRAIQLARQSDARVAAILIGSNVRALAGELAAYGAERVYLAQGAGLKNYSTDTFTSVLATAIQRRKPYAVLIPSTSNGRDLAPRVAARLKIGLTGDCIGLEIDKKGRLVQLKPAFGGNIVAPILTKTQPAMATIRPGMLQAAEPDRERKPVIERLPVPRTKSRTRVVARERIARGGVELDDANVIIGVGMGVGSPDSFPVVDELARVVGAPLGATRRVVDAGWLPRQKQVGLTGRSIAPHLYIALGISGKFNHTVGIQRSGIVLAINNNPEAPIFQQCDYGIVGDWAVVVPALTRALQQEKARAIR